jgi:hypothetical protein
MPVAGQFENRAGTGPAHRVPSCTGGHRLSPKEQNTQQSPALGVSRAAQPAHWWKATQPLVGIVSTDVWPQDGHVSVDVSSAMSHRITAPTPERLPAPERYRRQAYWTFITSWFDSSRQRSTTDRMLWL